MDFDLKKIVSAYILLDILNCKYYFVIGIIK